MDIVKKNLVSIVCGVLAIVSVVAIFWPLSGWYATMSGQVKASHDVGEALNRVRSEPRTWPTLSTNEQDKVALTHFPTEAVRTTALNITESWTKQANDFADAATRVQSESLKLLVPGSLPGGTGQKSVAYQFMDAYRKLFNLNNARPQDPATPVSATMSPPAPVLNTPLVGRMPPTDADVRAEADAVEERVKDATTVIANGTVQNQADVAAEVTRQRLAVADRLGSDVALHSMVYVDPVLSFVASDKFVTTSAPADDDIFEAQVGLWLQQEICRAVYETNKGSTRGVLDAPIKRLIAIRFTPQLYAFTAATPGSAPPTDVPAVPGATPLTSKVPTDFTKNPLGQTTNDMYDVLNFNMSLVCQADTLPETLVALSRGRYIAFKSLDVASVDSSVAYSLGFLYGDKPVVQVNLRGQYLMLRKFIGPLMPPDIIRGLSAPGGGAPAGGPPAVGPGGQPMGG